MRWRRATRTRSLNPSAGDLFEECHIAGVDLRLEIVVADDLASSCLAEASSFVGVGEQLGDGAGQRAGIEEIDQPARAPVIDYFGDRPGPRGDDRAADRHR